MIKYGKPALDRQLSIGLPVKKVKGGPLTRRHKPTEPLEPIICVHCGLPIEPPADDPYILTVAGKPYHFECYDKKIGLIQRKGSEPSGGGAC